MPEYKGLFLDTEVGDLVYYRPVPRDRADARVMLLHDLRISATGLSEGRIVEIIGSGAVGRVDRERHMACLVPILLRHGVLVDECIAEALRGRS